VNIQLDSKGYMVFLSSFREQVMAAVTRLKMVCTQALQTLQLVWVMPCISVLELRVIKRVY